MSCLFHSFWSRVAQKEIYCFIQWRQLSRWERTCTCTWQGSVGAPRILVLWNGFWTAKKFIGNQFRFVLFFLEVSSRQFELFTPRYIFFKKYNSFLETTVEKTFFSNVLTICGGVLEFTQYCRTVVQRSRFYNRSISCFSPAIFGFLSLKTKRKLQLL